MGQTQSSLRTAEQQTWDGMLAGVLTFSQARKRRENELLAYFLKDIMAEAQPLLATAWYWMKFEAGDGITANAILRAGCDVFGKKEFHAQTSRMYAEPGARFDVRGMDEISDWRGYEPPPVRCGEGEKGMGRHLAKVLMARCWVRLKHAAGEWAADEVDDCGREVFGKGEWEVSKEGAFGELWAWARLVCPNFTLPSGVAV